MNLQEFDELKPGDEIRNDMTYSEGVVLSVDKNGVRVAWGSAQSMPFLYTVNSAAWFHWRTQPKAEPLPAEDSTGFTGE